MSPERKPHLSESPGAGTPGFERPRTVAERRFAERATELTSLDLPARFARMYETNLWDNTESRSGDGSSLASTAGVRAGLPNLLRRLEVRRLLDIPCGDFHWMAHVDLAGAGVVGYVGGDVVDAIVEANNARYGDAARRFVRRARPVAVRRHVYGGGAGARSDRGKLDEQVALNACDAEHVEVPQMRPDSQRHVRSRVAQLLFEVETHEHS